MVGLIIMSMDECRYVWGMWDREGTLERKEDLDMTRIRS